MRSRWQIRGIATAAVLSLATGCGLAMAQAGGAGQAPGATPGTTAPGATPPGATAPGATAPGTTAPGAGAPDNGTGTNATTPGTGAEAHGTTQSGTTATGVSKSDKRFIRKAAQGGLAEVELGKLAQQRGSSQEVRDFGQRMVTDHSQANDKLMTIAQSLNVEVPTTLDKKDQATLEKLQSLHGAAFDRAYSRDMRADHRTDIREFEHVAMHGHDPQVRQFAESTLPTLKEHLAMAEKLPGASRTASAEGATSGGTTEPNHETAPR